MRAQERLRVEQQAAADLDLEAQQRRRAEQQLGAHKTDTKTRPPFSRILMQLLLLLLLVLLVLAAASLSWGLAVRAPPGGAYE